MANMIKILFETKSECEVLMKTKIHKKHTTLQKTQHVEVDVNKTVDFAKTMKKC